MIKTALNLLTAIAFIMALLTIGCSAQTEEQALQSLRQMSRENQLPPENVVAGIESRFAGKRTGALAKLLHARIRFENGDFTGAAAMLDTEVFRQKTSLGDYALWLRGRALQNAGNHAAAMNVFSTLIDDYPASTRIRDAKLFRANSALQSGQAAAVRGMIDDLIRKDDPDAVLLAAKA